MVRKALDQIRKTHDRHRPIHLFAAMPAPAAIETGRNLKQHDSAFLVYEYRKGDRAFFEALTINSGDRGGAR
jgi:hypothetical protein